MTLRYMDVCGWTLSKISNKKVRYGSLSLSLSLCLSLSFILSLSLSILPHTHTHTLSLSLPLSYYSINNHKSIFHLPMTKQSLFFSPIPFEKRLPKLGIYRTVTSLSGSFMLPFLFSSLCSFFSIAVSQTNEPPFKKLQRIV